MEVRYHATADSDAKVSLSTFFISNDIKQDEKPFFWGANFIEIQNFFFLKPSRDFERKNLLLKCQ